MSSAPREDGHADAPPTTSESRLLRLSRNRALFRDVNERVAKVAAEYVTHGPLSFICECSSTDCGSQIELTHEEYERVRSVPRWFLVRPGHEIWDIERVIESNERFSIVEKLELGKAVAIASDSRQSG